MRDNTETRRKQYTRQNAYNAAKYDRLVVMLPKGDKAKLDDVAKAHGQTVSAFVRAMIDEAIRRREKDISQSDS